LTYTPSPFGNVGINDNPKGNSMVRTPEWVFTSRLQYTKALPIGGALSLAGDWYYTSQFFWENSNQVRQAGYSLFGASSTYTLPDASWKVTAWGKNLANKNYTDAGFITGFGTVVNWAPPRTFGISVSKDL
jgi:iron complex outermembrane receptor protein